MSAANACSLAAQARPHPPPLQARQDLRRLQELVQAGAASTSSDTPAATGAGASSAEADSGASNSSGGEPAALPAPGAPGPVAVSQEELQQQLEERQQQDKVGVTALISCCSEIRAVRNSIATKFDCGAQLETLSLHTTLPEPWLACLLAPPPPCSAWRPF